MTTGTVERSNVAANPVTLAAEQVDFWDEQGYLVVPDVFGDEALDAMAEAALPLADENFSVILNIHREAPLFLAVMKDPVLSAMLKAIQRSRQWGLNSQYLFKKPGSKYGKQSWNPHQDNSYPQCDKNASLTMHIFIDPSEKINGGLQYWPGSHREDILEFEDVVSWKEEAGKDGVTRPGQTCVIPEKYKPLDIEATRGAVCFQHGHLIHSSYPNESPTRWRRQYSIFYVNEGQKFRQGKNSIKIPVPLD